MSINPFQILEHFGRYIPDHRASREHLAKMVKTYTTDKTGFDWLHAGKLSMPINELIAIIKLGLSPTRTGHLGNWQEMALGRACALDHNGTVCGKMNLGYPLILDLNQTENEQMETGDIVYLPGSIVNRERREKLSLFTWDGKAFIERSREISYFVPFVLTKINNRLIPLTMVHKGNISVFANTEYFSSLFIRNIDLFKRILQSVFKYIQQTTSPVITLGDIVDRRITLQGQEIREKLHYSQGEYKIGGMSYSNYDDLIEAILLPLFAAHEPTSFFERIAFMPQIMPFLSLSFICVMGYILSNISGSKETSPACFKIHMEWGAFDSAGYPPRSGGYYKKKAGLIKNIYEVILAQKIPGVSPLLFVLLPSAIFNLLPSNNYPQDVFYIEKLLYEVLKIGEQNNPSTDIMMKKIEKMTDAWFKTYSHELSAYYVGRFTKKRCVHHQTQYHDRGEEILLPLFEQLTVQQACMLTGALYKSAAAVA